MTSDCLRAKGKFCFVVQLQVVINSLAVGREAGQVKESGVGNEEYLVD